MSENKLSIFGKDDIAQYKVMEKLLTEKALWKDLSTSDAVMLYKSLVWFANLKKTIEDNSVEIISVKQVKKPKPE